MTKAQHTFRRNDLGGAEWNKYVIHKLRHGTNTSANIEAACAWALDNIQAGGWMVHKMSSDCALFYIADPQDALLFELGYTHFREDRRGRKRWGV